MKLGEIVVHMKNKKVSLIAHFSVQNFKVSVESWKSNIVCSAIRVCALLKNTDSLQCGESFLCEQTSKESFIRRVYMKKVVFFLCDNFFLSLFIFFPFHLPLKMTSQPITSNSNPPQKTMSTGTTALQHLLRLKYHLYHP